MRLNCYFFDFIVIEIVLSCFLKRGIIIIKCSGILAADFVARMLRRDSLRRSFYEDRYALPCKRGVD